MLAWTCVCVCVCVCVSHACVCVCVFSYFGLFTRYTDCENGIEMQSSGMSLQIVNEIFTYMCICVSACVHLCTHRT